MNRSKILIFFWLLVHTTLNQAITCPVGSFYQSSKCYQCIQKYKECTGVSSGIYRTQIVGGKQVSGVSQPYCSSTYYNKNTDKCQVLCKEGCKTCAVDYDFCLDCSNGYTFNNYTCIPAVIGLEAASLALLAIGLVFSIFVFSRVQKLRKN